VIYADLDELEVYPGGLIPYLEERERCGQAFARGRLVDRLAANGELIEVKSAPTLWEQFPLCRPVTRHIVRGWDRKVCAARACVPIAGGGAVCRQRGEQCGAVKFNAQIWDAVAIMVADDRRGRCGGYAIRNDAVAQDLIQPRVGSPTHMFPDWSTAIRVGVANGAR